MAFFFGGKGRGKRQLADYEIGCTIGEGATSKVKRGREIVSGRLVALKIMDPQVFKSHEVQQELEILQYFGRPENKHPNVCGLVAVLHDVEYKSKFGKPRSKYDSKRVSVIVTEYVDGGDLFSYVSSGVPFNEETARAVFQQVVRGVSHLHKHGVVHLDLKPENILLGKNGIVKITDFGLSEIVKPLRTKKKKKCKKKLSSSSSNGGGMIRSAASLCSLSSMDSNNTSPLVNFYPTSTEGGSTNSSGSATPPYYVGSLPPQQFKSSSSPSLSRIRGGSLPVDYDQRPLPATISGIENDEDNESNGSDDQIFNITNEQEEEADNELFLAISQGKTRPISNSQDSGEFSSSASMNKIGSYNSISSLDSSLSSHSKTSKDSLRSVPKYPAPKLVVSSRSGTLSYQAPEVAKGNYDGCKADVFSLGVVLHVMLYGVLPYEEGEWDEQRDYYEQLRIENYNNTIVEDKNKDSDDENHDDDDDESIPEWTEPKLLSKDITISESAKDLLLNTLVLQPETRFTLKDTMKHSWVSANELRGSVLSVKSVVKRREPYVKENRQNQSYLRKARKRGYGPTPSNSEMFL